MGQFGDAVLSTPVRRRCLGDEGCFNECQLRHMTLLMGALFMYFFKKFGFMFRV